jgi:hypothetical protein
MLEMRDGVICSVTAPLSDDLSVRPEYFGAGGQPRSNSQVPVCAINSRLLASPIVQLA